MNRNVKVGLITAMIVVFAVIIVFFVLPYFNIAFFDSQCWTVTGFCSANPLQKKMGRIDVLTTADICGHDCKVRNFRCSFDTDFMEGCAACLKECNAQAESIRGNVTSQHQAYRDCIPKCAQK